VGEPVESFFCDSRIREIRLNYESKVLERFLENYVQGLRLFKLAAKGIDGDTGKPVFVVASLGSDSRYYIRNWNCTCNEIGKTGVACPHLILAASKTA